MSNQKEQYLVVTTTSFPSSDSVTVLNSTSNIRYNPLSIPHHLGLPIINTSQPLVSNLSDVRVTKHPTDLKPPYHSSPSILTTNYPQQPTRYLPPQTNHGDMLKFVRKPDHVVDNSGHEVQLSANMTVTSPPNAHPDQTRSLPTQVILLNLKNN